MSAQAEPIFERPHRIAREESALSILIASILSHLRLVLLVASAGFLIGVLVAVLSHPVYVGDVLIQVEEKKGMDLGGIQQIASALDIGQSPTAGEIEIIKSREVIGSAINTLHLDIETQPLRRIPFFADRFEKKSHGYGLVLAEPWTPYLSSFAWGGEHLSLTQFDVPAAQIGKSFRIEVIGPTRWRLIDPDEVRLAEGEVGQSASFEVGSRRYAVHVETMLARPGQAFAVSKLSWLQVYRQVLSDVRVFEPSRQSSILRITSEARDPNDAANLVNEIARAYLNQNVSRRSEEAERSLEFLDQQLPKLKKQVESSEESFNSYRLSRQSINLDKESEGLLNQSVDLEKQRVDLEMRRQLLAERFQANHPDVLALDAQIRSIRSEEEKLKVATERIPVTQQEYFRLDRDLRLNTDLYTALLNNAQQLRISRAGTIGNVRIVDFAASPDQPIRPDRPLIVIVSTLLGICLGGFIAFAMRQLRPTIGRPEEVERLSGIPTYAVVPDSQIQKTLFRLGRRGGARSGSRLLHDLDAADPAIEALRAMRMGLQFAMSDSNNKIIAITGPLASVGKTFIASNLAAILASGGSRVLLIDADLRRPRVQDYFGISRTPGLSNVLARTKSSADVTRRDVRPSLDIICAGDIPPNPAELLASAAFAQFLSEVTARYDVVIVDTPPLLPVADALSVCRLVSNVFMVLRAEQSTPAQLEDAMLRLLNAGIRTTGVVFNGLLAKRLVYGGRYAQYYGVYEKDS